MSKLEINDTTTLNPKNPWAVSQPRTEEELRLALKRTNSPVTIAGSRYTMGGQTAQNDAMLLDMTGLNKILSLDLVNKQVRIQAGATWAEVLDFLDPHDLSISVMQRYINFTVGGSLSTNCHGHYMDKGPISTSVLELTVMLADGSVHSCSRTQNIELFNATIGGFGAVSIIVDVLMIVEPNVNIDRVHKKVLLSDYKSYFSDLMRSNQKPIYHNAELIGPNYTHANVRTWRKTTAPRNNPILFSNTAVRTRNQESLYDVEESLPKRRDKQTFAIQEYFVPIRNIIPFIESMKEILQRYNVDNVNVMLNVVKQDKSPLLSWSKEDCYAIALNYEQETNTLTKMKSGIWTRELIDLAIKLQGTYYLAYQPHATEEQFRAAYPRWEELFELKRKYDPEFKLQGSLWMKYYEPWLAQQENRRPKAFEGIGCIVPLRVHPEGRLDIHRVFNDQVQYDHFYRFLQNVFQTGPEDEMHALIAKLAEERSTREDIYRELAREHAESRSWKTDLTYIRPWLSKQRSDMCTQIMAILNDRPIGNHLEIGTHGTYVSGLPRKTKKKIYVMPEKEKSENIRLDKKGSSTGTVVGIADFEPLGKSSMRDAQLLERGSLDSVTCLIGLHHCPAEKLHAFLQSVYDTLKPGGIFIIREYDVIDDKSHDIASLSHEVFSAVLGDTWEDVSEETRLFRSCNQWSELLKEYGLQDLGHRIAQNGDTTRNMLMGFEKK